MRLRGEGGSSLAELMIVLLITSLVAAVILGAYPAITRTDKYTDTDTRALAALRYSIRRIEREVREARRVYAATGTRLKIWVDRDRDNQQDLVERITWESFTVGEQAQLRRFTDQSPTSYAIVANEIVPGDVFSYDAPAADQATRVAIVLTTDIRPGPQPERRTVRTELMLRNAVSAG